MARNQIRIAGSVEDVFAVLADPYAYPQWVVGAREVIEVDPDWPQAGTRFRHRTGLGAATFEGTTFVRNVNAPHRIDLEFTVEGLGRGRVVIELSQEREWVEVTLEEHVLRPLWPTSRYTSDVLLHVRNAEALRRLKALVEGDGNRAAAVEALSMDTHWLDLAGYRELFDMQSLGYLAIESRSGPHVTPVAYSVHNGRVWVASPRASLKVRLAAGESKAGFLVRDGDRAAIALGEFDVVDPLMPWTAVTRPERTLLSSVLFDYARANVGRIVGYVSRGAVNPKVLVTTVFICLEPDKVCLVDGGDVVDRRGLWDDASPSSQHESTFDPGPEPVLSIDVPDDIEDLTDDERRAAVVGWESPAGPVPLPAKWHGSRSLASVSSALLQVTGVQGSAPASICLDDDSDPDLDKKRGILLRGTGSVRPGNLYSAIGFDLDKATYWRGRTTDTTGASSTRGP